VLDLAERIHGLMRPDEPFAQCCDFVKDREFNDQRYDIDTSKLKGLGWDETVPFDEGLADTVRWYSEEALPNGFWPEIKMTIACSQTKDPHRRK
jgi:dTDP-D-glucose 4,6-dehydratase